VHPYQNRTRRCLGVAGPARRWCPPNPALRQHAYRVEFGREQSISIAAKIARERSFALVQFGRAGAGCYSRTTLGK
jgi:hypothetical protein